MSNWAWTARSSNLETKLRFEMGRYINRQGQAMVSHGPDKQSPFSAKQEDNSFQD